MTKGYMQIETDEWIEPQHGTFIAQCCDCCLTHVYRFAVIDRKSREEITGVQVQFKLKIDKRRTSAARRKFKFQKDE